MNITEIISHLDKYLLQTGKQSIGPVEANAVLAKAGLLKDNDLRKGKPLRDILRKGNIPHAYQAGGKGSEWTIPNSKKGQAATSNYLTSKQPAKKATVLKVQPQTSSNVDITQLKKQLGKARLKYKPESVKFLLIAEAAPDSIDRFFYYENVRQHDYLFLGVAQALYPDLKDNFIASGRSRDIKTSILKNLQADGFYLLDLCELPLSLMAGDLASQLPILFQNVKKVIDTKTKIILIKATVYDMAFSFLQQEGIKNLIDVRIPFPGQGGQILFQKKFKEALKLAGHNK